MRATPATAPIAMPAIAPPLSPESLESDDVSEVVGVVVASLASPVVAVPDFDASAADWDAADAEEAAAAEAEDADSTLDEN